MRKTEKQAGTNSLALVLGTILLVWTALLAATSEPAGAQSQKAQSEEIRMTGRGGNELTVTAERVTITSDDVVVTKEARNTGQVQDSSGVVGDEEGGSEPKVGSDEAGTSPEDSPIEEAVSGSPADRDDAATEGERGTAGEETTIGSSSTEESLSEEGMKPEALLRMALEECAVVVSEDKNVLDNDPSEKTAPEATTTTETSTTDEAADEEQPSEGSAEENVSEEQRGSGDEATPKHTPDKKTGHKKKDGNKKKDGKEARHAKKDPETVPIANEDPSGTEEVVPGETTNQEKTGEATAKEAQTGDSASDTAPAKKTTAIEETAEEETTTPEEDTSENEDDENEPPDGTALGLTQDDCEKMFAVIAEYNELYDSPAGYDNDETEQLVATPESEPAEGESSEDDDGVEGEDAGGSTGEGTTPGGAPREERLARPGIAGTEEAASTEEAKEETAEETTSPGQGSGKGSGFAFRSEEEAREDSVTATPEGEPVVGGEERMPSAPTEPPAGSRTVNGEDDAVGETTSERTTAEETTTSAAEKAPDSFSWGQRSSTTKNVALPEQKTPDGTRAVLPKTGGPSPGAFAPLAALTAGLPLGAILGVLSLGTGIVLVGFARQRRGSSSAAYSHDEQDEGDSFRQDG